MNFNNHAITLTYGDQAENHKGMQIIGQMAETGFNLQDLTTCKQRFEAAGNLCELIHLNQFLPAQLAPNSTADPAYVLVVRGGVNTLLRGTNSNSDGLFREQVALDWDSKAFMYGRVVNKHARHNLCYSEQAQEPDYEEGRGRIIGFDSVPLTKHIREQLPEFLPNSENLQCEGNHYFSTQTCGIGFHIDKERKKVIGIRIGESNPLHYQWYFAGEPVGTNCRLDISHGDLYVMNEMAKGISWKRKGKYDLRHAAGCAKYTTV
jgi:hypothetical protein